MPANPRNPSDFNFLLPLLAAISVFAGFVHLKGIPAPEIVVAMMLCIIFTDRKNLQWTTFPRGTALPALLLCLLLTPALTREAGIKASIQVLQLLGVFFAAIMAFRISARNASAHMYAALCAGWMLSVAWALGQWLRGLPAEQVCGFMANRAVYGIIAAAAAPLVLTAFPQPKTSRAWLLHFLLVLVCGITLLYLPAMTLFIAGVLLAAMLCLHTRARIGALAGLALLMLLVMCNFLPRSNRAALLRSVAAHDASGMSRRWVLEMRAGVAGLRDAPLAGHGPGRFQTIVSSGRYRSALPETAENRVEPGTQCGYLVLAVEYGLPATFMLLLLILAGAARALSYPEPVIKTDGNNGKIPATGTAEAEHPAIRASAALDRALALSLLLLAIGMACANLLVQGVSILAAALLGIAFSRAGDEQAANRWLGPLLEQSWLQAGLIVIFFAACAGLGQTRPASTGSTGSESHPMPQCKTLVIEAESASGLGREIVRFADRAASGNAAVMVKDNSKKTLRRANPVILPFAVDKPGKYRLWLRAWWRDGCGNSFAAAMDGGKPMLVGNDGTYRVWHWVEGPVLDLKNGRHELGIMPRESGARLDQVLLADNTRFHPLGKLTTDRTYPRKPLTGASAMGDLNESDPVPTWNNSGRAPKQPFVAGIGGDLSVGAEAFFVSLGLPYERLLQHQYFDPGELAKYRIVWFTAPAYRIADVWKALRVYVKNGGTAFVEVMQHPRTRIPAESDLLAPFSAFSPRVRGRGLTVSGAGSRFFKGMEENIRIRHRLAYYCPLLGTGKGRLDLHGKVFQWSRYIGPAIMRKPFGRGRLYVMMLPLGLMALRGQNAFYPVARRLILDAVDERYQPLYANLKWNPLPRGLVHFADDFMRESGEGRTWKAEYGKFNLMGASTTNPMAFSLKMRERASAIAGNPAWRSYRVSAAVFCSEQGAGGIWLSTTARQRLGLILDGKTRELVLLHIGGRDAKNDRILKQAKVPEPFTGWRRISLFARNGKWQAWIDSRPLLTLPATEDAAGRFGVFNLHGKSYVDDVRVCDTAIMLPDLDTCLGEEGSPHANPPFYRGLEPHSVYSPVWLLRPDPQGRHAVRMALPTYCKSRFSFDGKFMGEIHANDSGALVYFPQNRFPVRAVEVVCPLWRDYVFGGRTVDWYATGSPWKQQPRWSCDPQWTFLGTSTRQVSTLWYRSPLTPPYSLQVLVAPSMEQRFNRKEQGRDLNLVFGGNGRDPCSGFSVHVSREGTGGCELFYGKKRLLQKRNIGLPTGPWALHHYWFELKVVVEHKRVRFCFNSHPAFDAKLPANVQTGYVGLWTSNNALRIARATLSLSSGN